MIAEEVVDAVHQDGKLPYQICTLDFDKFLGRDQDRLFCKGYHKYVVY